MATPSRESVTLPHFLENLPAILRKRRWLIMTIAICLLLISASFIPKFRLNQAMTGFFEKNNQTLMEYNWFKYLFGSDDILIVMLKPKEGTIFQKTFLETLRSTEQRLNQERLREGAELNRITRIRTLISADYLTSTEDALVSRPFIGEQPLDNAKIAKLRQQALSHKDWPGSYFSQDESFALMRIETDFGAKLGSEDSQPDTNSGVDEFEFENEDDRSVLAPQVGEVPELIDPQMAEYEPFIDDIIRQLSLSGLTINEDYFLAGNPRIMAFFSSVILKEMGLTLLGTLLTIFIVLLISFRSLAAIIWPSVSLIYCLLTLFGIIGFTGIEMTFMINIISFLLLAVTIATSIHIISGYTYFLSLGKTTEEAIGLTYRKSGVGIILAGITTGVGMLSLTFVPLPAIRHFAIFAVVGISLSLIFNIIMWPIFLSLWAPKLTSRQKPQASGLGRFLASQSTRTHRYRHQIIAICLLLFVGISLGIPKVKIDSNFVSQIRHGFGLSEGWELIDEKFGGTATMEVLINTGIQDGAKNVKLLRAIETIENDLEVSIPMISRVNSLVTATKESNKALHQNDERFYRIPDTDTEVSHVLFNFESADPESRRLLVDDNWQILRMNIAMKNMGSSEYLPLFDVIDQKVKQHLDPLINASNISHIYSGAIPLMMGMVSLISLAQIQSFSIALAVICMIMLVVFRSLRLGIIATIPNILPIAVVMGYAGWTQTPLDLDTLLVIPIAIGIAVDDTIHFLIHFKIELNEGRSIEEAIDNSLKKVGRAMFFTTVVLSLGFSIYLRSIYIPFINFGVMSVLAVGSALLADLFLLPILLRTFIKFPQKLTNSVAMIFIIASFAGISDLSVGMSADEIGRQMIQRQEGRSQYSRVTVISCSYEEKNGRKKCSSSKRKKIIEQISSLVENGTYKKGINIVREPASDKGIAFLQKDYEKEKNDSVQWLYLPSLRKVKRIVSAEKNSPKTGTLFGSEIAYEDIEKTFIDDFTFSLVREDSLDNRPVWILESKPTPSRAPKTSYARSLNWVDKESYISLKSELYDRQNKLAKTFFSREIVKIDGIWIAKRMIVVNHHNKRMSMMKTNSIKINQIFPEELLSPKGLSDKNFRDKILEKIR